MSEEWRAYQDSEGKTYYYNATTGVTQWHLPSDENQDHDGETDFADSGELQSEEDAPPKDYVHMARTHALFAKFCEWQTPADCVLCHTKPAQLIFFPCRHKCVCEDCKVAHEIR